MRSVDEPADSGRHVLQGIPQAPHFIRALFDHHFEHVRESAILPDQVVVFEGALNGDEQVSVVPRFGDEFVDARLVDGVDGDLEVSVGGQEDADGLGANVVRRYQKIDPVEVGHLVVCEDEVGCVFVRGVLQLFKRGGSIDRFRDSVASTFEQVGEDESDGFFVINEKNMMGHVESNFQRRV